MQNAEAAIVNAKKTGVEDAQLGQAYDRFLPIAIAPPYNRKALALEYARRLQLQDKPKRGAESFDEVPQDDKRIAALHQMIASKQVLDALPPNDPAQVKCWATFKSLPIRSISLPVMRFPRRRMMPSGKTRDRCSSARSFWRRSGASIRKTLPAQLPC